MLSLFGYLFFSIGFTIAIMGLGYGIVCLIETIQNALKRRNERLQRLLTALERIEENTRNKPNQG